MTIRTDRLKVRDILPASTTLEDHQISAAIAAASCVVDECDDNLTVLCAQHVETYLSAHFASVTENTLTLKSETNPCSGSKAVYGFEFGQGIMGTPFGQMANTLSGGCLAEMDKQPTGMVSIGTH